MQANSHANTSSLRLRFKQSFVRKSKSVGASESLNCFEESFISLNKQESIIGSLLGDDM